MLKKSFFSLFLSLSCSFAAFSQTARVQIIHNAPAPTVDIWAGNDRLLNDFAFRTATPFIDVPAGVTIPIGVALSTSNAAAESIATFPVNFTAGRTYVVVATGIVGGNPGFTLKVFDMGLETTANPANIGLCFFHGSPDAPTVDITTGGNVLFNNASYGDFQGYLQVPATAYDLAVTPGNDNNTIVASYRADFNFWRGRTAVVFASGFLGGGSPAFEPWVALSNGGTFPLSRIAPPPPPPGPTARVQIIHNAPTPTVDIWAGNSLLLNDFAFRTATPFIDVPAGVTIPIGVALRNSASAADAIATFPVNFTAGKTYVVVATGIVGGTPGFTLKAFDMGLETTADPKNVGICFFHGSPDAPTVDITTGGNVLINNASYGDFQGYLQVPATSYILAVTPGNDNNAVVARYKADLEFWKGRTAVIFASGFLGGGSPGFEPWVALSNGGTFPLAAANNRPEAETEDRQAAPEETKNTFGPAVSVFPNPAADFLTLKIEAVETESVAQIGLLDALGRQVFEQNNLPLQAGENLLEVRLPGLKNGNYVLRFRTDAGVATRQVTVLR